MILPTALENLNVLSQHTLLPPARLHQDIPVSHRASDTVRHTRETLGRILLGQDPRLLVVVGPCSIHDITSAMDYARRLKALADDDSAVNGSASGGGVALYQPSKGGGSTVDALLDERLAVFKLASVLEPC